MQNFEDGNKKIAFLKIFSKVVDFCLLPRLYSEGGDTVKATISERECLDVARIMSLMADRNDMPPQYGAMMKRGASLLMQVTCFCNILSSIKKKEVNP